jgi:MFS superfamily sulfate permease-like transporter
MTWLLSGGWMPALWAATVACLVLSGYMRILAPSFTALQAHSFFGYHVRRMKRLLKILNGDREKLERVNRVRKLDNVLPALTGATLIGWSVHFSGILGAGRVVPQVTLYLTVAASLIAVGFDYLENARIGAMVDSLPAEPADDTVRAASRVTALKLWSYLLALVVVLLDAGLLILIKAAFG